MDGKILILCGEKPTITQFGKRIDENGKLLDKIEDGRYRDLYGNEIEVDEYKRIISATDLRADIITESIESDMIFADWETVIPTDIEPLIELQHYAETTEKLTPEFISHALKNESIMKSVYLQRLNYLMDTKQRPSIDYRFAAMDDFFRIFTELLEKNGIVEVLPTYPKKDDGEINTARRRVIETWNDHNKMEAQINGKKPSIELLPEIQYETFGQIHSKAQDAMMKLIGKPYWFETPGTTDEGPGGRD